MGRVIDIAIDMQALFKNFQNKNKEFTNKISQAKKVAKKAKTEVEMLKKKQVKMFVKLASALTN